MRLSKIEIEELENMLFRLERNNAAYLSERELLQKIIDNAKTLEEELYDYR